MTPAPLETFADRMRFARKMQSISQATLAKRAGLPASTIGALEHGGHIPRADHAIRIAKAMAVRTDWLIAGEGRRDR